MAQVGRRQAAPAPAVVQADARAARAEARAAAKDGLAAVVDQIQPAAEAAPVVAASFFGKVKTAVSNFFSAVGTFFKETVPAKLSAAKEAIVNFFKAAYAKIAGLFARPAAEVVAAPAAEAAPEAPAV